MSTLLCGFVSAPTHRYRQVAASRTKVRWSTSTCCTPMTSHPSWPTRPLTTGLLASCWRSRGFKLVVESKSRPCRHALAHTHSWPRVRDVTHVLSRDGAVTFTHTHAHALTRILWRYSAWDLNFSAAFLIRRLKGVISFVLILVVVVVFNYGLLNCLFFVCFLNYSLSFVAFI